MQREWPTDYPFSCRPGLNGAMWALGWVMLAIPVGWMLGNTIGWLW